MHSVVYLDRHMLLTKFQNVGVVVIHGLVWPDMNLVGAALDIRADFVFHDKLLNPSIHVELGVISRVGG